MTFRQLGEDSVSAVRLSRAIAWPLSGHKLIAKLATPVQQAGDDTAYSLPGPFQLLSNSLTMEEAPLLLQNAAQQFIKALLPHFRQRKSGTTVSISSRSGWCGDAFLGPYSGTKFALEGLVESLWRETEPLGLRTVVIEPGRFRTLLLSSGNLKIAQSSIPDYSGRSEEFQKMLAMEDCTQPGDVEKGVSIILDLVRADGVAAGKEDSSSATP
ncbi:hypothetical protein CNMCM5793_000737 [Aspergillus hiratsukae]|uniref:Uncharacterized protein n=1 Tax=Aspergillus hiratsukae TaxID=1194566 RepID=A0A8H6UT81_9EURO|nr:hypothetical protein CNMCM5793_000737 [Aspergillus hiratsukae]KAF7166108.1 hypothetical protein CNMCM6106_002066 [Aspergillus hiratsukae]